MDGHWNAAASKAGLRSAGLASHAGGGGGLPSFGVTVRSIHPSVRTQLPTNCFVTLTPDTLPPPPAKENVLFYCILFYSKQQ